MPVPCSLLSRSRLLRRKTRERAALRHLRARGLLRARAVRLQRLRSVAEAAVRGAERQPRLRVRGVALRCLPRELRGAARGARVAFLLERLLRCRREAFGG